VMLVPFGFRKSEDSAALCKPLNLSSLFRNPKGTSITITARFRPRQKQHDDED